MSNSYDRGWGEGFSAGILVTFVLLMVVGILLGSYINPAFTIDTKDCHTTYTFDRSASETKGVTIDKFCKEK